MPTPIRDWGLETSLTSGKHCEQALVALYYINPRQGRLEVMTIKHQFTCCRWVFRLVIVAFCLAVTIPVMAQQSPPLPADRVNSERERQRDMSHREYQLRSLGAEPGGAGDENKKKALMAQVEQDFNRILLLHNQFVRAVSSDAPLDYRFVSDASNEIKKRSTRLQSTLVLGQSDDEKQDTNQSIELEGDKLKPVLVTLCTHIKDFVTNPIIETPGTVDAKHLAKAKRDLSSVISLSEEIRKHADRLRKN